MGGWVAGLTETKTKPNPRLKLELKFGAELCKNNKSDRAYIKPKMKQNRKNKSRRMMFNPIKLTLRIKLMRSLLKLN